MYKKGKKERKRKKRKERKKGNNNQKLPADRILMKIRRTKNIELVVRSDREANC
jgi:hypothetical protein